MPPPLPPPPPCTCTPSPPSRFEHYCESQVVTVKARRGGGRPPSLAEEAAAAAAAAAMLPCPATSTHMPTLTLRGPSPISPPLPAGVHGRGAAHWAHAPLHRHLGQPRWPLPAGVVAGAPLLLLAALRPVPQARAAVDAVRAGWRGLQGALGGGCSLRAAAGVLLGSLLLPLARCPCLHPSPLPAPLTTSCLAPSPPRSEGTFVRELAALPLADDIPVAFDSCRKGPRGLEWRDDKPAEARTGGLCSGAAREASGGGWGASEADAGRWHALLAALSPACTGRGRPNRCLAHSPPPQISWIEAQDGGDPAVAASPRDIVYCLGALACLLLLASCRRLPACPCRLPVSSGAGTPRRPPLPLPCLCRRGRRGGRRVAARHRGHGPAVPGCGLGHR